MSFLELPVEARQKIYSYAGLRRPCAIDMLHETDLKRRRAGRHLWTCAAVYLAEGYHDSSSTDIECFCSDLAISILRVCRKVYDEALAVLYGSNDFMILAHSAEDLQAISRIPASHIEHMRSLLIRLNCWPCLSGHDFARRLHQPAKCAACGPDAAAGDPVLSLHTDSGRRIMGEWSIACSHLALSLVPHLVHLSVIADVAGEEEADKLTAELRRLPTLKRLDLRLGRNREPRLREIANKVVETMTRQFRPSGIFPFERLPAELRLKILGLTELACTDHAVYSKDAGQRVHNWQLVNNLKGRNPHPGFIVEKLEKRRKHLVITDRGIISSAPVAGTHTDCCRNCTLTAYSCCCHDAYAASSAYCLCRLIPFALFYVSRAMHRDATQVFYSRNSFVLYKSLSAINAFLQEREPSHLRLIKDLVIVPVGKPAPGHLSPERVTSEFEQLISLLKEKLNLHTLNLTFDMVHVVGLKPWHSYRDFYEGHCRAVQQIRALGNVRKVTTPSCISEWNDEMKRQLAGEDARDFSEMQWPLIRY